MGDTLLWTVYGRLANGDVLSVDDCRSRAEADEHAERDRARVEPGFVVEVVEHVVHFISRANAAKKIRALWLDTYTRQQLLAAREPEWSCLRNYELEDMLDRAFGRAWCIGEWCPYNGQHCMWRHYAAASGDPP